MIVHVLICSILGISVFLEYNKDFINKKTKIFKINSMNCFILGLLVILVFGIFKDPYWGIDSIAYDEFYFLPSKSLSFNEILNMEFFSVPFLFFSKIISFFVNDFIAYKGIIFVFSLIGPCFLIYKLSRAKTLSLLIYYCISASQLFFSLRQAISISIICFSIYYALKNKWIITIILFILACLIHSISVVSIFTILFIKYKNILKIIIIVMFSALVYLFSYAIIEVIIVHYRNGMYISTSSSNGGVTLAIVCHSLLFILYAFIKGRVVPSNTVSDKLRTFYFNNYALSCWLQVMALKFSTFNRTRFYSNFYLCLLVPDIIENIDFKRQKLIVYLISIGFIAFYVYTFALKYPYI